ncbi:MAG: thioredoxin family protein [Bacteroidales bacterium]|nr:thioredoxin family protein [Bacteroidales bacterium]
MEIIVFGSGCKKCEDLVNNCQEIVNDKKIVATVRKVTDINEMINHGVLFTPALMINDKIVISGKVPTRKTLENRILSEV